MPLLSTSSVDADGNINVTAKCPACGEESTLTVNYDAFMAWKQGMLIQDAFPLMSPDEREILMTGYHSICWDLDFAFDSETPDGF